MKISFIVLILLGVCILNSCTNKPKESEYVVVANVSLKNDSAWLKVVERLAEIHAAEIVYYANNPIRIKTDLQRLKPRYVAFVDPPESIGMRYIIDLNRMCRSIDDDIYADYQWGIITGYTAGAALSLVENGTVPTVLKTALTTTGVGDAGFERYAGISDGVNGQITERPAVGAEAKVYQIEPDNVFEKFFEFYENYDPDIIFSSSHATEYNLEMPFGTGQLVPFEGRLCGMFANNERRFLHQSNKPKVYFPVGNCLIGNVKNTKESMAVAWLSSEGVTALLGYVVPTWYGRGGWGALRMWNASPGRYTLAEAFFLNQQAMQYEMSRWGDVYRTLPFPHEPFSTPERFNSVIQGAETVLRNYISPVGFKVDHVGMWYDQDVMAYYGDPKWNAHQQKQSGISDGFTIDCEVKGAKCILTINTASWFALDPNKKDRQPLSYIFPRRLNNPRLAKGVMLDGVVADDFILIYNPNFEPGQTYRIELDID